MEVEDKPPWDLLTAMFVVKEPGAQVVHLDRMNSQKQTVHEGLSERPYKKGELR
jgi:hypothetical protein